MEPFFVLPVLAILFLGIVIVPVSAGPANPSSPGTIPDVVYTFLEDLWKGDVGQQGPVGQENMTANMTAGPQGIPGNATYNGSYAFLPGVPGGQILNGGTGNNENLTLNATANGVGHVFIQPNNGDVMIGYTTPGTTSDFSLVVGDKNRLPTGSGFARLVGTVFANTGADIRLFQIADGIKLGDGANNINSFTGIRVNPMIWLKNTSGTITDVNAINIPGLSQNSTVNAGLSIGNTPGCEGVVGNWSIFSSVINNSYFKGNVGFGNLSPNRQVTVQGIQNWVVASSSNPADMAALVPAGNGAQFALRNETGTKLFFDMRISAGSYNYILNNYFGLGTITPTAQLHTTENVRFANFGAGAATFDALGQISSVSDEKVKTAIQPFTAGLTGILKIHPIKWIYSSSSGLDTSNVYTGFSAQDVQRAIPEIVYSKADVRYETKNNETVAVPTGTYTLSVYDRGLMAAMVNAIKEQQVIIENQQNRIAALEKKVGI